ncbi:MAG: hypothetical protein ABIP20_09400 [Chthoniobacteraceae bacterium]
MKLILSLTTLLFTATALRAKVVVTNPVSDTLSQTLHVEDIAKPINTMPHGLPKRIVYAEVARMLDIPGGKQIVKESYAQIRKFDCWNISIVQQDARFKECRIRSAVFGNNRRFFLMRQNDRPDRERLAASLSKSGSMPNSTLSF